MAAFGDTKQVNGIDYTYTEVPGRTVGDGGQWLPDAADSVGDFESVIVKTQGDTFTPSKKHTEIQLVTDVANARAEGTLLTDPFDATDIVLAAGQFDGQRVDVKRDGPFIAIVDTPLTDGSDGAEAHSDFKILSFSWNATESKYDNLTDDTTGGGSVTSDTVLSTTSTNPVENRAIANTLASDTGFLVINGGTY